MTVTSFIDLDNLWIFPKMLLHLLFLTWINQKKYCIELARIDAKKFVLIRVNSMPNPCFLYKLFTDKVLTVNDAGH